MPDETQIKSMDEVTQPSLDPPPTLRDRMMNPGDSCEPIPKLHPFIQGLLDALPESGTDWPDAKRKIWLRTAEDIFCLLYKDDNLDLTKGI